MKIQGLAVPYGDVTDLRAFGGRITFPPESRAFQRFTAPENVFMLAQHDSARPLARVGNGSLLFTEDTTGLKFSATLPNTTEGRDIFQLIKSGVLDGISVGFRAEDQDITWDVVGGESLMKVNEAVVEEVSIVTWPALKKTNVRPLLSVEINAPTDSRKVQPNHHFSVAANIRELELIEAE